MGGLLLLNNPLRLIADFLSLVLLPSLLSSLGLEERLLSLGRCLAFWGPLGKKMETMDGAMIRAYCRSNTLLLSLSYSGTYCVLLSFPTRLQLCGGFYCMQSGCNNSVPNPRGGRRTDHAKSP